MSGDPETPYQKLQRTFATDNITLENTSPFENARLCVFRDPISEIDRNVYPPHTIACCYLNQLAILNGEEWIGNCGEHVGNIVFPDEFVNILERFIIPADGKVLRGFTFISSWVMNQKILDSFKELGALWIGRDVDGTQHERTTLEKSNCMYFVHMKYATFAVVEDIQLSMLQHAESYHLYTVTYYYAPTCFFRYRVTIAARHFSDLQTVHPLIPSSTPSTFCRGLRSYRQGVPVIVISLGFKGFKMDGFLFKLAQKLGSNQNQVQEYRICYYFGARCEKDHNRIQGYFADPHNEIRYNNAVYTVPNGASLNMSIIPEKWSFALTHSNSTVNILENVGEDYLITIPVPEVDPDQYSIQLVRHPSVRDSIWNFTTTVNTKKEEVVADGWFNNF